MYGKAFADILSSASQSVTPTQAAAELRFTTGSLGPPNFDGDVPLLLSGARRPGLQICAKARSKRALIIGAPLVQRISGEGAIT